MRFIHTLRFKLIGIFLLTIVTPIIILAFVLPFYAQRTITNDTEKLTAGTVNSLARNIQTYFDDLERLTSSPYLNDNVLQALKLKASNRYESADAYTRLQADRALSVTLPNYLINTRDDILSTVTVASGGVYLTSTNLSRVVPDFPFESQDWYRKAVEANGKAAFISAHPQNYLSNSKAEVFSVARLIKDPDSKQNLAVVMADADFVALEKITQDITFNVSSIVIILDDNNNIIYANKSISDQLKRQLESSTNPSDIRNSSFVTVSKKLPPSNWNIVVLLSQEELRSKVRWFYLTAMFVSAGGLFVTFFVFYYFSRWIVIPFKRMNEVMREVRSGNLQTQFKVSGKDEIAQLGESFNRMIGQLDELINREYKAVLAQRDAEYRALQSKIQPHFLYNTLNGFIGLNRAGETKKLESAVFSLSGMLRYILEGSDMAFLKDEFDFMRKYSMLQQLRFEERLTVHLELDDSAAHVMIPKLLLQPIVENAIIHGVEPSDKPCQVNITAKIEEDREQSFIRIEIADDGIGFDATSVASQPNIGISNVRARLQMLHEEADMTIRSSPGTGTVVNITIPTKERQR